MVQKKSASTLNNDFGAGDWAAKATLSVVRNRCSICRSNQGRVMDEEKQGVLGTAQGAIIDAAKTVIDTASNVATGAVKAVRKRMSGPKTKRATLRNAKKKAVAKKSKKAKAKKAKKAKAKKRK